MNPAHTLRRFRFELLLTALVVAATVLALASCGVLTEQPKSLTERIALADASAQWAARSLGDWAVLTEQDALAGRLPKQQALERLDRIHGYLCDLGLAGGMPPADCPLRNAPTARALLAESGVLAGTAPAGAEHRLVLALTVINSARAFLRPYIAAQGPPK